MPKQDDLERGRENFLQTHAKGFKRKVSTLRAQFMITEQQRLRHKDNILKKAKAENTNITLQREVMFLSLAATWFISLFPRRK